MIYNFVQKKYELNNLVCIELFFYSDYFFIVNTFSVHNKIIFIHTTEHTLETTVINQLFTNCAQLPTEENNLA